MLTRISLIIVILAGVGAIVFGQLNVKKEIVKALDDRDLFHKNWQTELAERQRLEKELALTKEELENTKIELAAAQEEINRKNTEIARLNAELDRTNNMLARTRAERDSAQAELSRYQGLGLTVEQIREVIDRLKESSDEIKELKVVIDERDNTIRGLESRIRDLVGPGEELVILPAGLRGKVMTVDPKWDFVVVNVGKNQGALPNGQMLVSRDGKLLGKIRLVNVLEDHSIANMVQGWKLEELMEGDLVVY